MSDSKRITVKTKRMLVKLEQYLEGQVGAYVIGCLCYNDAYIGIQEVAKFSTMYDYGELTQRDIYWCNTSLLQQKRILENRYLNKLLKVKSEKEGN